LLQRAVRVVLKVNAEMVAGEKRGALGDQRKKGDARDALYLAFHWHTAD
jgi:hypothetical protein